MTLWNLRKVIFFSWDQQAQVIFFYPWNKFYDVNSKKFHSSFDDCFWFLQWLLLIILICNCAKDREDIASQNPCSVRKCPICNSRCNNTNSGKSLFVVMPPPIKSCYMHLFLLMFSAALHTFKSSIFESSPSSCLRGAMINIPSVKTDPTILTINGISWLCRQGMLGKMWSPYYTSFSQ